MINRYLGNKQEIVPWILDSIHEKIGPTGTVGDLCAGSLSVSMALKSAGYNVVLNDINSFSLRLGQALILPHELPEFTEVLSSIGDDRKTARISQLNRVLDYLEKTNHESPEQTNHYRDCYSPGGKDSSVTNRFGKRFERRFFTEEVSCRIDIVLGWIRTWHHAGLLSEQAVAMLLSCTMRAMELRANSQGTFHECIRELGQASPGLKSNI